MRLIDLRMGWLVPFTALIKFCGWSPVSVMLLPSQQHKKLLLMGRQKRMILIQTRMWGRLT
eukprot:12665538-Prorocentrum_lima.AAC.1